MPTLGLKFFVACLIRSSKLFKLNLQGSVLRSEEIFTDLTLVFTVVDLESDLELELESES